MTTKYVKNYFAVTYFNAGLHIQVLCDILLGCCTEEQVAGPTIRRRELNNFFLYIHTGNLHICIHTSPVAISGLRMMIFFCSGDMFSVVFLYEVP